MTQPTVAQMIREWDAKAIARVVVPTRAGKSHSRTKPKPVKAKT